MFEARLGCLLNLRIIKAEHFRKLHRNCNSNLSLDIDGAAPLEAATGNLSEPFEGGLKSGNASTAAAAASASAWGASVLSSAEGW
jgi:hypothetical protein